MYDLSPGITMRSTIPAYSYRHGLNFIPGIVKTRIDCYSGISNPSLIVMVPIAMVRPPSEHCFREITAVTYRPNYGLISILLQFQKWSCGISLCLSQTQIDRKVYKVDIGSSSRFNAQDRLISYRLIHAQSISLDVTFVGSVSLHTVQVDGVLN